MIKHAFTCVAYGTWLDLSNLYLAYIVQSHGSTCLFSLSFQTTSLAIYHLNVGAQSRRVTTYLELHFLFLEI